MINIKNNAELYVKSTEDFLFSKFLQIDSVISYVGNGNEISTALKRLMR